MPKGDRWQAVLPPSELQWLVATIWGEARGEPYLGQLAVAYVILTRAARFPGAGIGEICLKPFQFSTWNTSDPNRTAVTNVTHADPGWRSCTRAALTALYGLEEDPSKGADHFVAKGSLAKLPTWWDETKETATIGRHTFARLGGA